MNKTTTAGVVLATLLLASAVRSENAVQEESGPDEESFPVQRHPAQIDPFSEALPPEVYKFRMRAPVGTDMTIRTSRVGSEKKTGEANSGEDGEPDVLASEIIRRVREQLVMEITTPEGGSETTRYYLRGWTAFDHPRLGINVRRTSLDGSYCPLDIYTFPELFWAWPERRIATPETAEGKKPIHIYEDGIRRLEVDAESGLPRRFVEGSMEYLYNYKQSQSPILLPESLKDPVRRVMVKAKGKP